MVSVIQRKYAPSSDFLIELETIIEFAHSKNEKHDGLLPLEIPAGFNVFIKELESRYDIQLGFRCLFDQVPNLIELVNAYDELLDQKLKDRKQEKLVLSLAQKFCKVEHDAVHGSHSQLQKLDNASAIWEAWASTLQAREKFIKMARDWVREQNEQI